ncbi:hypothetical protein VTK73DRAFT_6388 [Phialemonium thermophilum]|uniref:Nucleoporin NDC1 n=1 Tax=Phialemonium thermophilum TaxID=223376 RepID=A0ABR3XVG5_9PEZI
MAPAVVRKAPYKDFLQPALHRRFSTTASILLVTAYFQALLLGSWDSLFWSWFPIGPAGIRTFFLSLCGLSIIVLRIAQYHVGLRTSNSPFETFAQNALKLQTLEAVLTYVFSGWLFSLVYIWSSASDSSLSWVTYYSGDRARLNEKPLFFTCHFVIFGVVEACLHIFRDNDRLSLGVADPRDDGKAQDGKFTQSQLKRFLDEVPSMLIAAATQSLALLFLSIVVYPLFLRGFVWRTALIFFRPFYNLPKTNILPASVPFSVRVLYQSVLAGTLLSFVWQAGNRAFSIFLVREPLKNGKPLTSESKDPNGSLLNGLKSKKLSIKCFAMWELAFIARDYENRRKAIYEDIDRKDGPMWSQVYVICLDVIKSVEARIDNYGKTPSHNTGTASVPIESHRRPSQALKQDPILQSTPQKKTFRNKVEDAVSQIATSPGQPPQLSPIAKKAMTSAKDKLLQLQREATGSDDPQSLFKTLALKFLSSSAGWPFRQEYNRRLTAAVLGTPYGEPSLYINAISALSQLTVHSLKEDKYGNVQRDVATILRTMTSVTRKLESFKSQFPTHWTDVTPRQDAPEVDAILAALRNGLANLVDAFGPYARDLRLSLTDIRLAKEAAGISNKDEPDKRSEMRQVR